MVKHVRIEKKNIYKITMRIGTRSGEELVIYIEVL